MNRNVITDYVRIWYRNNDNDAWGLWLDTPYRLGELDACCFEAQSLSRRWPLHRWAVTLDGVPEACWVFDKGDREQSLLLAEVFGPYQLWPQAIQDAYLRSGRRP